MFKMWLVYLVVVAYFVLTTESFYLEIPESSSHKKAITSSIADTVSSIKWMEDQLFTNQLLKKNEDIHKSYRASASGLLEILQTHKTVLEKVLQTNPKNNKDSLPDIQNVLLKLVDSEEIDAIIDSFSDDFAEVSFKLGLILEEFPSVTRNALQSLTSVILLNNDPTNANQTQAEVEKRLLDNCNNFQNLTNQMRFVYDGPIIEVIFAVKQISDMNYFRVDYNKTLETPRSLKKLIAFEAANTRSMIIDRWQNLLKELKEKFNGVPKNSTINISKFHTAYLNEINSTRTFIVETVDTLVVKFTSLYKLFMENIDLELLQIRSALLEKSLLSKDARKLFESYKDQLIAKAALIRDVTKKIIDLVNNTVDVEKDPFGNISNRYVQTFSYQTARISYRTLSGNKLQENYEKYLKMNGVSLRKNLLEPSKIFKEALAKKFTNLLTEITAQGYKIVQIGFTISDFVKSIEVK